MIFTVIEISKVKKCETKKFDENQWYKKIKTHQIQQLSLMTQTGVNKVGEEGGIFLTFILHIPERRGIDEKKKGGHIWGRQIAQFPQISYFEALPKFALLKIFAHPFITVCQIFSWYNLHLEINHNSKFAKIQFGHEIIIKHFDIYIKMELKRCDIFLYKLFS